MARQLFFGKIDNFTSLVSGSTSFNNGFIRIRGDFDTASKTITNVVDVAGYEGISAIKVGQQLIASTVMPTATVITAVDAGAGTITVNDFPSATGTNSLARIQPQEGQAFIRSGSLTDPQSLIRVNDITGSEDSDYTNSPLYAVLGQAFDGTSNIPGRFHKYVITDILYRDNVANEFSAYVTWSEATQTEAQSGDRFSTTAGVLPIVALTHTESLAPLMIVTGKHYLYKGYL
jgi:hypothetical protein